MTPAYIALGSNLNDPPRQLRNAVAALELLPDTQLQRVSSIYRSAAVGPGPQPDYLNAVLLLTTALSPLALLDAMQQIELDQDRVREVRWGPRTIDLDLLLYGDMKITSARLTVPHPRMQRRDFVLVPLREISGDHIVLPDGANLNDLLKQCPGNDLVKTQYPLRINRSQLRG